MKNEKELNILHKVEDVNSEINKLLVPVLQDTIRDTNKHNKRMFILTIVELVMILVIALFSVFLVYKQNVKYQEFLSQFEFGEETVYQDLDATDNSSITNSIITNN